MHRLVAAPSLLVFLAAPAPAQSPANRAAALLEDLARPTADLPPYLREHPIAGVSVAVARDGRLVYSGALGHADLEHLVPATSATVYNIGSISKAIATVAVLQLVERGRVHLEDPVQRWVPAFPLKRSPVSLWHVLTHTSGIRHYRNDDFPGTPDNENVLPITSVEQAIAVFKDDPLLFEPGDYYRYSSYAVNLLQWVVESASGSPFEDYLRENVWEPAEMTHTGFDVPARIIAGRARGYRVTEGRFENYPYGDLTYKLAGGGMVSTAEDLVRFALAITRGCLLRPETVERMFTPQLERIESFEGGGPLRWQQLLMWRIRIDSKGRPFINHSGNVKGFYAGLVIYPDDDVIAAVIDNADSTSLGTVTAFADLFLEDGG